MVKNAPKSTKNDFLQTYSALEVFFREIQICTFWGTLSITDFSLWSWGQNRPKSKFQISKIVFAKNLSPPSKSVGNRYKSSFSGFGTFLRDCMLRFWKNSFLTILHWICQMSKKRRKSKNFCCNPRQKNRKSEIFKFRISPSPKTYLLPQNRSEKGINRDLGGLEPF